MEMRITMEMKMRAIAQMAQRLGALDGQRVEVAWARGGCDNQGSGDEDGGEEADGLTGSSGS
jgi:hypothetical protein